MFLINKNNPLKLIVKNYRYKKSIILNINKELQWLSKIIIEISINLETYNQKK